MYQNIYIENKYTPDAKVHIWDDERGYSVEEFNNYGYVIDENGRHESIFGDPLKKCKYVRKATKNKVKQKTGRETVTFETDVRPETRYLVDNYLNDDEPSKGHTILFFDIEVSMHPEVPDVKRAQNTITSIAYYDDVSQEKVVFILDQNDEISNEFQADDTTVVPFDNEKNLLEHFVNAWRGIDPTIVVGFNSDFFDIPYLYRRLKRLFDESFANRLSPIGIVDYNERKDRFYIAGISSLDYYQLYKNFTFSQLDSYSLDSVAEEELGYGKVTYKGREYQVNGETRVVRDLDDLFELDIDRFVRYNMDDVMLLVEMDDKLDFIDLARKICHLGHVPYEDIYNSSRYIDGAILTFLKRRGLVAPDKKRFRLNIGKTCPQGSNELVLENQIPKYIPKRGTIGIWKSTATKKKYEYVDRADNRLVLKNRLEFDVFPEMDLSLEYPGAFVKSPDPGLYEWVYDLDLTSMYPSIIMTLNISPETKVGRVYDWDAEQALQTDDPDMQYDVYLFDRHKVLTIKKSKLFQLLKKRNLSIASNGVFYRNDIEGTIPRILEKWFTLRQDYKGTRNEWREKATEITDQRGNVLDGESQEDLDEFNSKAEYYDKLQHVHKILINCFSEDTEIMTLDGVKNVKDVKKGDLVYSLNRETMDVEIKPVSETSVKEYDGDMVNVETNHIDFSITPNHRLFTQKYSCYKKEYSDFDWEYAADLLETDVSKQRRLPSISFGEMNHTSAAPFFNTYLYVKENNLFDVSDMEIDDKKIRCERKNSKKQPYIFKTNDYLEFLGWYISEGSLYSSTPKKYANGTARGKSYRICISQQKNGGRKEIEGLLDRMNLSYTKNDKDYFICNKFLYMLLEFDCGSNSFDKKIPSWVWSLCNYQKKHIYKTLMLGDGDKRGDRYSTSSEALKNDMIRLGCHLGINIYPTHRDKGCYRLQVSKKRGISPTFKKKHVSVSENKSGYVYCLEVEDNHTVLAGRNGKFNWIGQSVYGVLGLSSFRFYDVDNAQAVTDTGRSLIQFTQKMGDKYYNQILGTDASHCIYMDTDSTPGDTEIETNLGRMPIRDLFDHLQQQDGVRQFKDPQGRLFVFSDGSITTPTYTTNSLFESDITYIERHSVPEKDQYKITTENGESVVVTEDHSIMVETTDGELVKKKPTSLQHDDVIVTISRNTS